jgi:hypothetical protein
MGLYYHTMIREIRAEFHNQNFELESFLLANFDRYQEKYQLPELLMYLNLDKICEEENISCPTIHQKLRELIKEETFE